MTGGPRHSETVPAAVGTTGTTDIGSRERVPVRAWLRRTAHSFGSAWRRLAMATAVSSVALLLAFGLLGVGALALVSLGLPMVPVALSLVRRLAESERRRLSRTGETVRSPYRPLPGGWWGDVRTMLADPATWRDLMWLGSRALLWFVDLIVLSLPLTAVRDLTLPLWWYLVPPDAAPSGALGIPVTSAGVAWASALMSPVWLTLAVVLPPLMGRVHDRVGRAFLPARGNVDLAARITELTATRAAALDAHTAELRRIERALHDGAQNRLVGVAILSGAARRAITRDPAGADAILERVQTGAEEALAELRTVIRSILPPILDQRGLDGALSALAAGCGVPCEATVDVSVRCPTSVEATAYFVVAEALTNVSKHSRATRASVRVVRVGDLLRVEVRDDGVGGADEANGSGLTGLRGRVAAHDGTVLVSSPKGGPTMIRVELPCGS